MSLVESLKENLDVDGVNDFIDLESMMDEDDDAILESEMLNDNLCIDSEDPDLNEDEDIILDADDLELLGDEFDNSDPDHEHSEDPDLGEDDDNPDDVEYLNESVSEAIESLTTDDIDGIITDDVSDDDSSDDDDDDDNIDGALDDLRDILDDVDDTDDDIDEDDLDDDDIDDVD